MNIYRTDGSVIDHFAVSPEGDVTDVTDPNDHFNMENFHVKMVVKEGKTLYYILMRHYKGDWMESPYLPCWFEGEFYSLSENEVKLVKDAYNVGVSHGIERCKVKLGKLLDP